MKNSTESPEYDKDELVPPKWLNKKFFENFLLTTTPQRDAGISHHITNITIEPATKKGVHFASVMFRIKVTVETNVLQGQRSVSFIVKAFPELEGNRQRLLHDSKLFETEIGIYTEVLPQLENVLRLAGVDVRFGAKCLYTALTPVKVLVFEDLTQLGYKIVPGRSLTLEAIKAAYRKLAQWHAASYKLTKEHPAIFEKYHHNYMTIPYIINSSFISSGIANFIHMLESVPTLSLYKPYFQKLQPNWVSKCRSSYMQYFMEPQSKMFYGICHGDVHGNNMMFENNTTTGELTDVLLVDYQLSYMGPLVNDLIYAFFMLYTAEQRINDHAELLEYYFHCFLETLQKMGCQTEAVTFENLQVQLKHQKVLALFLLTSFLPMRYAVRAGLVNRDHMMATDEERLPLYFDADYIEELHHILPMYLRLGYLE